MGLRFRKSINLGGGFKVNLSKSGIGYSWGVPGARYTKTATGRSRQTLSIPGTGISYVTESGKSKHKKTTSSKKDNNKNVIVQGNTQYAEESVKLGIGNITDYQNVEYAEFIEAIENNIKINTLSIVLMLTFFLSGISPLFLITFLGGIALFIYNKVALSVPIEYEFDDVSKNEYEKMVQKWENLSTSKVLWSIHSSAKVIDKKQVSGAENLITRTRITIVKCCPNFLKSNMKFISLKPSKETLYFLPDKLLIVSGYKVGAVSYQDLNIKASEYEFIEGETVPKDSEIIKMTWLKVNKNGTPDKRYKDNRQIPICRYGLIKLTTKTGMDIRICCSNYNLINNFK